MRAAPRSVLTLLSTVASLILAGCAAEPVAQTPPSDLYVTTPDGGARYVGDVTRVNRGVLPGAPSAQAFAAVGDTVSFGDGQVALNDQGRGTVGRQAAWLARHQDFQALIEGHADEQGTREYNLALGARRAASVQEYLIAQGVEPSRITTVSYGNERPLAECAPEDAACAARNRRAVTVVSPGSAAVPAGAAVAVAPGEPAV